MKTICLIFLICTITTSLALVSVQQSSIHYKSSTLHSTSSISQTPIWYSDPSLFRANIPSLPLSPNEQEGSIGVDFKNGYFIFLQDGERGKIHHLIGKSGEGDVKPLFLTFQQTEEILGTDFLTSLIAQGEEIKNDKTCSSLIWLGSHYDGKQYWAVYNGVENFEKISKFQEEINKDETSIIQDIRATFLPLREFGDRIPDAQDAAIYSVANGLIEFHRSHKFCSTCGSPTLLQRAGGSRLCSNSKRNGGSCSAPSIYPRIDIASIMLITSPCENYALLGRKASWPEGRYSTLAGFLEIGETLEDCCARETLEESGVAVDKDSITFVRSQPWPFPRSLMVGFRAKALSSDEVEYVGDDCLPQINFDVNEMEDVSWFRRDFVASRLDGGSTALLYDPTNREKEFHIPGKASLARHLITAWAVEK